MLLCMICKFKICDLVSLQWYAKSLSIFQRSSLVEKARQKPKERLSVLSDTQETCKYDDYQMLKSCGIKTDSEFTQVKGRVLSDPKLKVGDREDLFPRNEWWNFNSKKLVEPTRVNDQYLTNILLKINGNLGGLNSMLTTEHGLNIPVISKALAMMLGMDVSHGSPGQADVPSISKYYGFAWAYHLLSTVIPINLECGRMDTRYDGLTFVSVRGVGHEVPRHRPQLALVLVKAFLSGTTMPTPPQVITDY
ncbi:hypothetical protein GIB67_026731 [Kingdonia uniflora]|uniref:Piwi domain-containing protein n=1 Tax=Kingdonia uniflora TaxID=39325 RepID=A0A7J7MH79_9MAGN|nr:hypothetical protein GIB67_026731 [Kingdonia uniflora]